MNGLITWLAGTWVVRGWARPSRISPRVVRDLWQHATPAQHEEWYRHEAVSLLYYAGIVASFLPSVIITAAWGVPGQVPAAAVFFGAVACVLAVAFAARWHWGWSRWKRQVRR